MNARVFSNRKMRLNLFSSGCEFGSAVNGMEQSFSSLLDLHGGVIVAHSVGLTFESWRGDPRLEVGMALGSGSEPLPGAPIGQRDSQAFQFSTLSPGTRRNSRSLFVTSTAPAFLAWAAIIRSLAPIICPLLWRCERISA